jgi:hypothetical protein
MTTRTTVGADGHTYVSVTSAMALVKDLLGEPQTDCYGPPSMAKVHALEGSACHAVCLDWIWHRAGKLPEFTLPPWPEVHGDERRWQNVLSGALTGFQEFVEQYGVQPIGIEEEAFSIPMGLVGHVDLLCTLRWKGRRVKAVTDLKFVAGIQESHRLQLRCYARLRGINDVQIGLLFHANRNTGSWKLEPVNLHEGLRDVLAVSHAAHLILPHNVALD